MKHVRAGAVALALLGSGTAAAQAQPAPEPPALGDESILFHPIEWVSAASRFEQKVTEAPSSITIVTAEEIQQHGYQTLAEILQSVRGLYTTNDHNYVTLGARGFARPGDYNTRILLLLDGRRLNDPVYDEAAIGTEALVDVDLIERVEVIRGPSSSIYGPNAFFAVVNVITRRGRDREGLHLAASAGSLGAYDGRLSYGRRFAGGLEVLVAASARTFAGGDFYFPELDDPSTNGGWAVNVDRDRGHRLFAQLSHGSFNLLAAYSDRWKRVPTGSWGVVFNDPRNETRDRQAVLDLKYERRLSGRDSVAARAFYNRYFYDGSYVYEWEVAGGAFQAPLRDHSRGERAGLELQYTLRPRGRHHLLAGAELRSDFRQDQAIESPEYTFLDRRSSWNWGLFIQDEVSLAGKLSANLGVRHDHYGLTGGTTSPRIGLIFLPHEHSSLKLLFGQGFRPPNVYELYYDDGVTQRGGAGRLSSERVWTYEAAWEHGFGPHVRSTVSAYAYRLRGLTSQTTDPADGRIVYVNAGVINARGLEAEVQGRWKGGVEGRLSWAVQTAAEPDGHALSNSPRHLATLNLRLPLAPPRVSLGVEARYIARRRTLAGGQDPGHAVANVTLLARGLGRGLDVAASVCNVFDRRYGDPGSEEHLQDVIAQYGRTFRVTASGRF